jgi:hypothetical protein
METRCSDCGKSAFELFDVTLMNNKKIVVCKTCLEQRKESNDNIINFQNYDPPPEKAFSEKQTYTVGEKCSKCGKFTDKTWDFFDMDSLSIVKGVCKECANNMLGGRQGMEFMK